jgi:hypothetical protein
MSNPLDTTFISELGELSFRDYFRELLCAVISEGERFSGKRPFGNSGWFHELAEGLGKAGLVDDIDDSAKVGDALLKMIADL